MKRIYFFLLINLFAIQLFASDLVLIRTNSFNETKGLFDNPALTINFFKDQFVIATLDGNPKPGIILLDQNAWQDNNSYYVVYVEDWKKAEYLIQISEVAEVLHDGGSFLIVKIDETTQGQLPPAKNDGVVRIYNKQVTLPAPLAVNTGSRLDPDPFIVELLGMISTTNLTATVQHLQDYGTRNCYQPASIQAQNWIKGQFESYGLSVELMDFPMSNPASDNVIATLPGTKYPDEYVVMGCHYDSYSYSGLAPGADDNASGVAGVLEIARILSQYEFDRTIIFCTFSGEEYGLYGSEAYADRCAQQGMNILGYLNMDMTSYLQPGDPIHTDVIAPQSAQPLVAFYTQVCSVYLPDFIIGPGALSGGDSDHTSFNNAGFMGIFPFEDSQNYSPYIHTSNDIIGPSYNNAEQAGVFTKAILASAVAMADLITPPQNLVAIPGDNTVDLQWDQMYDIDNYKVYKNNVLVASPTNNYYHDVNVVNGTQYEYYVTAILSETGEETDPSNVVYVTPMPPIALPLVLDFENGAPYWNFEDTWGVSTSSSHSPSHSISESPTGQYGDNKDISATLNPINLSGYTAASLSFWTKYDLESGYDYTKLEVTTNGSTWAQLASFNGTQSSWQQKTYSLNAYLGQPYVVIRFHFTSDVNTTKDGMYIDDFTITIEGGATLNPPQNLAASVSDNDVNLTWTAPASDVLLGYNVYRDGLMIAPQISALTYDDMDLAAGTYSYQVCAVYTEGTSAMAGPVQAVITGGGSTSGAMETFEDYTAGQKLAVQANAMGRDYWTTWSNTPGSAEDPAVSSAVAHDGSNSVVIEGTNDCVLLLGDKVAGKYTLNFYVYIPTGFYGYFNVLQDFAGANSVWGTQAYFDAGGVGTVDAGGEGAGTFTYAYDTWNFVEVVVDLDADWAEFYFNGADVVQWQWSLGTFGTPGPIQLSAANFYAWNVNGSPKAYFDDVDFKEVTSSLIFEPFEDYTAGQKLVEQAVAQGKDYWTTWSNTPGSAEDPIVSTEYAFAGSNSVVCQGTNDFVMLFGDKTSGKYAVNFYIYIPTGKVGYYNILQKFAGANSEWGSEVYYNPNGTALITANGSAGIESFTYAYDEWIYMENIIDLNSDQASILVNGVEIYSWQWSVGASGGGINQLGGMDIYAATTNGTPYFFVDDIDYKDFLALAAPTNLVAVVNDNDITLTWNAPATDDFLGYNVYRDTEIIATQISALTYTDYDLLPGTYAYDVKAVYDEGYSSGAGPVNATIAGGTAREMVVLEIGTGTWCVYCPGAAMGADELTENGKDVAVVEYHSGDEYETNESGYRATTYYGITGFPTAFFDGTLSIVGGNATQSMYASYLPLYETRASKVSLFELSIEPEYLGGTNFNLTVNANNIYQYPGNNIVLHVICTESHIPVTWFVMDEVNFVCRDMLPDHLGTALDFNAQPNHTVTLPLNYGTWDVENCQVVAFLQDNTTKEILQATRVDLGLYVGIQNPEVAANLSIYPNPATNQVNIATSGTLTQVRIMNSTGQLVYNQKVDGQMLQVNSESFQAGVYFIEIHTTEGMTTQKLVIR